MPIDLDQEPTDFACEVSSELEKALDSTKGKKPKQEFDKYLAYTCRYVSRALDGYCCLRGANKRDAAKLLIRPMIEKAFYLRAVVTVPSSLQPILFTDYTQERSLVKGLSDKMPPGLLDHLAKQWERFSEEYRQRFPHRGAEWQAYSITHRAKYPKDELRPSRMNILEVSRISDMEAYYHSYFRVYCQHSHGSLRAMLGQWADLIHEDSMTAAFTGLVALDTSATFGADVKAERIKALWDRARELGKFLDERQKVKT